MNTGLKIFCVITLCLMIVGCGTYRAVWQSQTKNLATIGSPLDLNLIEPGDDIRVTLRNGQVVEGAYVSSDATALVIDKWTTSIDGDSPGRDLKVSLSRLELDKVEYEYSSDADVIMFLFGTAVVAAEIVAHPVTPTHMADAVSPVK